MNIQPTLTITQRLWRLLKEEQKQIGFIFLYAVFAGILNLILPIGIQAIIGFVMAGAYSSSWWLLSIVVTIGTALVGILVIMQMSVNETIQRRVFSRVSFDFAQRITMLDTERLRKEYIPELVNRFFDTLTVQKGLPKMIMDLSTAIMQISFGLILLSLYNTVFVVFSFILIAVLILVIRLSFNNGFQTSLKESKYKYEVAYWLEEIGRTVQTFKLVGNTDLPLQKIDDLVSKYLDFKKKHFSVLVLQYSSIVIFKTLITFTLLLLGSFLVIENQISIGQFVAVELIVILILNATEKLIVTIETVYDVLTAIEKIGAVADLPLEKSGSTNFQDICIDKGTMLELQHVNYKFMDSETYTLKNINFTINSGERVCIAGYNGSGKTTLVQLIACLLNNYEGMMLYNEVPRSSISLASLRQHIGDYSSQSDIFKGTLLENITLGKDIPLREIMLWAKALHLDSYIETLKEGFNTPLMPQGKTLPRSVIAKIILLRSIVTKPKLLAIEEFFQNIDQTERVHIAKLLVDRSFDWTLVAVTNEIQMAERCDRILIMKGGSIIADGTIEEIKKTEHFANIFYRS